MAITLASITKGKKKTPYKILLFGPEEVGKSSWAAKAPDPIFGDIEAGTDELDVARFPKPETFSEVMEQINFLATQPHSYKTYVADTVDALEALIFADVIATVNKPDVKTIEDVGGGYGKGYVAALDRWRIFLAGCDRLHAKGMNVILLAHSGVKNFKSPEVALDAYDRYELKMAGKGAAALLKEWPKAVLFAQYDVATAKGEDKRVKGISTGKRIVRTTHSAAWDAKNRYNLPDTIPLDWAAFDSAAKASSAAGLENLIGEVRAVLETVPEKIKGEGTALLEKAKGDAEKLGKLRDWLKTKVVN